jgi:hypothetical protein
VWVVNDNAKPGVVNDDNAKPGVVDDNAKPGVVNDDNAKPGVVNDNAKPGVITPGYKQGTPDGVLLCFVNCSFRFGCAIADPPDPVGLIVSNE